MKKAIKKPTNKSKPLLEGIYIGNARGFGFVSPKDGSADIFMPPNATGNALDGDVVLCEIKREEPDPNGGRPSRTGKVIKILSRKSIVGKFFTSGNKGFVTPSDTKIPYTFTVPPKSIKRFGLANGHVVVFNVDMQHVLDFDARDSAPPCAVVEVLGHINDPGTDILALVRLAGVPYKFSDEVMDEVALLPTKVSAMEIKQASTAGRLDLRELLAFTIDGEDTKDIDDAISFAKNEDDTYTLGVHIADVTHYVEQGTAIDTAALDRATSIYLADRVIPMLPHQLSSGVCSLFANVDRLTISCIMTINQAGDVLDYNITKSVINSKKRWTYDDVQGMLEGNTMPEKPRRGRPSKKEMLARQINWHKLFTQMDELRSILSKKREARGALDFNLPEAKMTLDEAGNPIAIELRERTRATGIIEEFMILCNETIAAHFYAREVPFVYRTHEVPGQDKLERLKNLLKQYGYKLPKGLEGGSAISDNPLPLQRLLAKSANSAVAQTIATAVLHTLPQARYTATTPTHYGLASSAYCHFTSPIRRYADLQNHRIIKDWLDKQDVQKYNDVLPGKDLNFPPDSKIEFKSVSAVCTVCSQAERIAEVLEREVLQLKKVQFMVAFEGKKFGGTVNGVTAWGVYVMLENSVEGMIPVDVLRRKGFLFDKERGIYIRKRTKKAGEMILRHGTDMDVRLVSADVETRQIELGFGAV